MIHTNFKNICAELPTRRAAVGYLSLQADGSISFGLRDRAYIASSQIHIRQGIWNAYNRVKIRHAIPSDPAALEPIENPHFTYHPPGLFHLKSRDQTIQNDDAIFRAPARVAVALEQDKEVKWITAISKPLTQIQSTGTRSNQRVDEELTIKVPSENVSIRMKVDFVLPECVGHIENLTRWCFAWHGLAIRVGISFTFPQIAILSWRHDC